MTSCPGRRETTVPAQALTLLNSKVAVEQSQAFAARLLKECGPDPKKLISRAWRLAFGRPITTAEAAQALKFLSQRQTALADATAPPLPPQHSTLHTPVGEGSLIATV